jgi:6-phosphogluconolactonase (cycloisomerase 2 family)
LAGGSADARGPSIFTLPIDPSGQLQHPTVKTRVDVPAGAFALVRRPGFKQLFVLESSGVIQTYAIDGTGQAGSGAPVLASEIQLGFQPQDMVVAPNGEFAWVSSRPQRGRRPQIAVYRIERDGKMHATGFPVRLAGENTIIKTIAVSPDGQYLSALTTSDAEAVMTYRIGPDTGELQRVDKLKRSTDGPAYGQMSLVDTPQGRFLFLQNATKLEVYRVDAATGHPKWVRTIAHEHGTNQVFGIAP